MSLSKTSARPGFTATLEVAGLPAAPFELFVSTARARAPISAASWGHVLIDSLGAVDIGTLVLNGAGATSLLVAVPPAPSLVGVSLPRQVAFPSDARRANLLETTIVGYQSAPRGRAIVAALRAARHGPAVKRAAATAPPGSPLAA